MRINKELPVQLTDAEVVAVAERHVAALERAEDLAAEKKSVSDGYTKQITAAESEATDLRKVIHRKTELREVECLETEVPGTNEVVVVRLDTGEEISRRSLTPAETQGNMFAEEDEDELRVRVLSTLALRDVLKVAGINATSDVLWQITPEQADEAKAWATLKQTDEAAEQPAWLAELVLTHPVVEEVVPEAETDAETAGDGSDDDETAAESTDEADKAAPAAGSEQETASQPGATVETEKGKAKSGKKGGGKKKAAGASPEAESAAQKQQAASSNGRLDEVDVQEELDGAGVSVGLDVIASWKPEQLIDAVNFARVIVKRKDDPSIEEPKRPAFLPAS